MQVAEVANHALPSCRALPPSRSGWSDPRGNQKRRFDRYGDNNVPSA